MQYDRARSRFLLPALVSSLLLASTASAAQAPESVAVVVNGDSWASLTVANEYIHLRHIPPSNVVVLSGLSSFDAMGAEQFRSEVLGPTLQALDSRGLRPQIDCIAYSLDLPNVVLVQGDMQGKAFAQVITPAASANGVTYLHELFMRRDTAYLDLDVNRYARRTLPLPDGKSLSAAERAEYQRGIALYDQKKYADAVTAIAPVLVSPCNDASVYYNFACCQALAGQADGAIASLNRAAAIGWRNHGQMASDPDLASLAGRADFKALVGRMKAARIEVQPTTGFRAETAWSTSGEPAAEGPHYLLSTMLGVASGRGNSVAEVLACLRRARLADGTVPPGTIYLMRNGDVRSTTREWAFVPLVEALRPLGIAARVEDGVLPQGHIDVAGAVVGTAEFRWSDSRSAILPGAICEHLTSCGGMMGERDGQTPCTEFIRAGAAGSSGAVTEPYALQAKFPSPFIQAHYVRGATLAEAYYQSLEGPYQLLIVGDPLCCPWSGERTPAFDGVAPGDTIRGTVTVTPHAAPGDGPPRVYELFVDGRRLGRCPSGGKIGLDTAALADGSHLLSLAATRGDALATRDRVECAVTVANRGDGGATLSLPAKAVFGRPISVEASCDGAASIDILHFGRTVARIEGPHGRTEIDLETVGVGPIELVAAAHRDGRETRSAPAMVDVELPLLPSSSAPTGTVPGLAIVAGSAPRKLVPETLDPAWIASRAQDGGAFEITGLFDAPAIDLWQLQIKTNTEAVVEMDGVTIARVRGDAWRYAPARLAAGTHRLRITGHAPPRAADARMDVRIGCAGTQHPSDARFRIPKNETAKAP